MKSISEAFQQRGDELVVQEDAILNKLLTEATENGTQVDLAHLTVCAKLTNALGIEPQRGTLVQHSAASAAASHSARVSVLARAAGPVVSSSSSAPTSPLAAAVPALKPGIAFSSLLEFIKANKDAFNLLAEIQKVKANLKSVKTQVGGQAHQVNGNGSNLQATLRRASTLPLESRYVEPAAPKQAAAPKPVGPATATVLAAANPVPVMLAGFNPAAVKLKSGEARKPAGSAPASSANGFNPAEVKLRSRPAPASAPADAANPGKNPLGFHTLKRSATTSAKFAADVAAANGNGQSATPPSSTK